MTIRAMIRAAFPFAIALVISAPAAAQDWQKEWADTMTRAKGQELNLVVHSYEAHEAVAREFQKKFTSIARPARTSEAVVRDVGPFVDPVKSPGVDGYKKSREDAAELVHP